MGRKGASVNGHRLEAKAEGTAGHSETIHDWEMQQRARQSGGHTISEHGQRSKAGFVLLLRLRRIG